MRKLIFAINVTIDGCCDHEKGAPNEEVHAYFAQLTRESGVLLYGRKTYELMVPFWPEVAKSSVAQTKEMKEFAEAFVSVPQIVVFSKTLSSVEKNTTILRSDLRAQVMQLKQKPGESILTGGVDIPSQLLAEGLVDEIRLVIHPVIAGKGRRLFDSLHLRDQLEFKLAEKKVFKSGHIALRYTK